MNETINIDGKEYILKSSIIDKKIVDRFDSKTELKLLKFLNKFFSQINNASEDVLISDNKAIIDPANVTMIYSVTERGKRLLSRFESKSDCDVHEISCGSKNSDECCNMEDLDE